MIKSGSKLPRKVAKNSLLGFFAGIIETNNILMLEAYDAVQKNVVKLKVDMLYELKVSVDYADADGD